MPPPPPAPIPRRNVAVYQFNSGLPDVPGPAVREMFVTALVQTGRFTVIQPNQPGTELIMDAVINEANLAQVKVKPELNDLLKGLLTGDVRPLSLDVRVIDARNGAIVDIVQVAGKDMRNTKINLADFGSALGSDKAKRDALNQRLLPYLNEAISRIVARHGGVPAMQPGYPAATDPYQQQYGQAYGQTGAYGTPGYGTTTPGASPYGTTSPYSTTSPYGTTNPYGTTQPGTQAYGYGQTGTPSTQPPYGSTGYPQTGYPATGQPGTQPYGQTGYPQGTSPYGTTPTQPGTQPYGQSGYPSTTDPYQQQQAAQGYGQTGYPQGTSPYGTTQPGTQPYGQTGTTSPYGTPTQPGTQPYGQTGYPSTTDPYQQQQAAQQYGQTGYPAGSPTQPGVSPSGQPGYPQQGQAAAGSPFVGAGTPYYGQLQPGQVQQRGIGSDDRAPVPVAPEHLMLGFDPAQHEVADVRDKARSSLKEGAALVHTAPSGLKLYANVRSGQVQSWSAKDAKDREVPLYLLNSEPNCWECAMNPSLCWKVMCPLESAPDAPDSKP